MIKELRFIGATVQSFFQDAQSEDGRQCGGMVESVSLQFPESNSFMASKEDATVSGHLCGHPTLVGTPLLTNECKKKENVNIL